MGQITKGVRSVLSHPSVYSSFQLLMGAHKSRIEFVSEYVRPVPGMTILDIGCGPADLLAYLLNVDYWGFDISEQYIGKARERYGHSGHFFCRRLRKQDIDGLPRFDVVLAMGLLHHLDDSPAHEVVQLAWAALKPGGRLLTKDPCLDPAQNWISRFLIRNDRGRNVRDKRGYEALVETVFEKPTVDVRHRAWIPYTHCIMECTKQ